MTPVVPVGKLGVPVKVGEAKGAFKSKAVCVAVLTGLSASAVLSTFPRPTIALVIPPTVPVKVGDAKGAAPVTSATGMLALAVIAEVPDPFT